GRCGEDAQDDRTWNAARNENRGEREPGEAQRHGRMAQVAVGQQGCRMIDDDAGVLESDESDEDADAAGDRELQRIRDRADDFFTDTGYGEREEDDAV